MPRTLGGAEPHPAIVVNGPWDLIAGGHRILGANITGPNAPNSTPSPSAWAESWVTWSEWTSWLKPQVDQAKAFGFNTVKLGGSVYAIQGSGSASGTAVTAYAEAITQATYLSQMQALLDYCRSVGMFVVLHLASDCGVSDGGAAQYGFTPSTVWLKSYYQAVASLLAPYADIVPYVDMATESHTWAGNPTNSVPMYLAFKANAPKIKVTWSFLSNTAPVPGSNLPADAALDVYEPHCYANLNAGDMDALLRAYGKPVIIGEFGVKSDTDPTAVPGPYNSALIMDQHAEAKGAHLAGAMVWSFRDQANTGNIQDQYGLQTYAGAQRTLTATELALFPR